MKLLISFVSTRYSLLREHWRCHSALSSAGRRGSNTPFTGPLGGKLVILDWQTQELVAADYDSPTGLHLDDRDPSRAFVALLRAGRVAVVELPSLQILGFIDCPLLNKPHSLSRSKQGLLVSSTGLDLVLELSESGRVLWEHWFHERGYPNDQFGRPRVVEKDQDHRRIEYPSLHQTTHVNFVRELAGQDETIVATLMHPGVVVAIDRSTAHTAVVVDGLRQPHNVRDGPGGCLLTAESGANRVLILENSWPRWTLKATVDSGLSWPQDAFCRGDTVFVADADNARVVALDVGTGAQRSVWSFDPEWRIFQMVPLPD